MAFTGSPWSFTGGQSSSPFGRPSNATVGEVTNPSGTGQKPAVNPFSQVSQAYAQSAGFGAPSQAAAAQPAAGTGFSTALNSASHSSSPFAAFGQPSSNQPSQPALSSGASNSAPTSLFAPVAQNTAPQQSPFSTVPSSAHPQQMAFSGGSSQQNPFQQSTGFPASQSALGGIQPSQPTIFGAPSQQSSAQQPQSNIGSQSAMHGIQAAKLGGFGAPSQPKPAQQSVLGGGQMPAFSGFGGSTNFGSTPGQPTPTAARDSSPQPANHATSQNAMPSIFSSATPLNGNTSAATVKNPFASLSAKGQAPAATSGISTMFQSTTDPLNESTKPQPPTASTSGNAGQSTAAAGSSLKRKSGRPNEDSSPPNKRAATNERPRSIPGTAATPNPTTDALPSEYAKNIQDQLRKDNIKPPQWPANPGDPSNRSTMENFRENYKKYRERVRTSLIKAGLVDDPEVRKRLEDAIDFKGISEDMCPEFEKITRIVQYDVKMAEKEQAADGSMWASTPLMVKALARSAAGQEAPLPMDVRSTAALKRTLNYLIDDVLRDDENLPSTHNFLWDRTRAIRRDFVFHSRMSSEEMVEQVYCLENITRFHAVALHLLSQTGFAADGFSEQQEREQLGKSLLSLTQAYDDCKPKGVSCPNEAEFRAYSLLMSSHHADVQQKLSEWEPELWHDSDDIQTAMSLVQAMQSIWEWRGPVKPSMPTTAAVSAFTTYFRIVEDPKVSYTMACFAEIHFTHIRRCILRNIVKAYSRGRDPPKDITVAVLNEMLRFDTDSEAVDFAKQHGLKFSSDGTTDTFLVLDRHRAIGSPTVRQSFSRQLVERKRGGRSLPEVIHSTVFETTSTPAIIEEPRGSDLFVDHTTTPDLKEGQSKAEEVGQDLFDDSTPAAPRRTTPTTTMPPTTATVQKPESRPKAQQDLTNGTLAQDKQAKAVDQAVSQPARSPFSPSAASSPFVASEPKAAATTGDSSSTFSFLNKPAGSSKSSPIFSSAPISAAPNSSTPAPPSFFPSFPPATNKAKPAGTTPPAPTIAGFPSAAKTQLDNATAQDSTAKAPIFAPPPITSSTSSGKAKEPTVSSATSLPPFPKPSSDLQANSTSATTQAPTTSSAQTTRQTQPAPAITLQPPKESDLMGDFTKWVVLGDQGLMEEFRVALTEHLVRDVFNRYIHAEEERRRKEAEEELLAEAMEFKTRNLSVKFFYRWREIARNRALNRRAREGREKMKAWQEARQAELRAAKKKAAEQAESSRRASLESTSFLEEMRASRELRASARRSGEEIREASNAGAALLATGILRGVPDERETVARVMRGESPADDRYSAESTPSKTLQQPLRALKNGFSSSVSKVRDILRSSGRVSKRQSSGSSVNGTSPQDTPITYLRQSLPGRTSKITPLARSLPPTAKTTNFSRYSRRSATPDDDGDHPRYKFKSNLKSTHWRLRALGMVQMPNKQYLHESLAYPMLDGKRFAGVGSYGLPPAPTNGASNDPGDATVTTELQPSSRPTPDRRPHSFLVHHSPSSSPPNKRKRSLEDDDGDEEADSPRTRGGRRDSPSPPGAKKRRAFDPEEADKIIQEMREAANSLDEGRDWFKEQTELMQKGISPWDR